jgi:transcriptional regulator with XRE-family HTH domain
MRIKVTARRVSNWLTGERSPNVAQLAELLRVLPDVDARGLITDLAARYRSKR